MYWCCARLESNRENVARHFLQLAGYETYFPRIREQRVRRHRRVEVIKPLFPSYAFIAVELQWRAARWSIGVADLKKTILAKKDLFARCVIEKMLIYALGRGLEPYDDRAVDKALAGVTKSGFKFSSVVAEIVKSDPFRLRRGKGVQD